LKIENISINSAPLFSWIVSIFRFPSCPYTSGGGCGKGWIAAGLPSGKLWIKTYPGLPAKLYTGI
jgi:hypothetical protein